MKQLFEVTTKRYKKYYTMAHGYDEAKDKIEREILEKDDESILDANGSLKSDFDIDTVVEVKCLSDKLIK